MVRAPFYDKSGMKKGAWSVEEDDKLRAYIQTYGHWNWRQIPKYAGISRCGKSCRLRWMNYLRPGIKRGDYTQQEEDLIIKLHKEFGNKWSTIAENLPGRTDNEIKNHWHTYMKKKRKTDQRTNQFSSSDQVEMLNDHREESSDPFLSAQELGTFASSKTTHEYSSSSLISVNHAGAPASTAMASCLEDQDSDKASSSETLMVLDQEYSSTGDFWTQPFLQEDTYIQSNIIISEPYALFYGDGLDLFDQVMPTIHQDHA